MPIVKKFNSFKELPFIRNNKDSQDIIKKYHLKFIKKHLGLKDFIFSSDYKNGNYIWVYELRTDDDITISIQKNKNGFDLNFDAEILDNGLIDKKAIYKEGLNLTSLYSNILNILNSIKNKDKNNNE